MKVTALMGLEEQFEELSLDEQLLLIERLIRRLRNKSRRKKDLWEDDLVAMSADPEVQRELRRIDEEFRCTEADGLEEY
jgi:hypothetical protein